MVCFPYASELAEKLRLQFAVWSHLRPPEQGSYYQSMDLDDEDPNMAPKGPLGRGFRVFSFYICSMSPISAAI